MAGYAVEIDPFSTPLQKCWPLACYRLAMAPVPEVYQRPAWMKFSKETFNWKAVYNFIAVCTLAVIVFTLIYEILFLNKERELDNKIVDQLDHERSQAELKALSNEMDPHFIFNSLNTLNHLILNNPLQRPIYSIINWRRCTNIS